VNESQDVRINVLNTLGQEVTSERFESAQGQFSAKACLNWFEFWKLLDSDRGRKYNTSEACDTEVKPRYISLKKGRLK
jgi:hypothetical protein